MAQTFRITLRGENRNGRLGRRTREWTAAGDRSRSAKLPQSDAGRRQTEAEEAGVETGELVFDVSLSEHVLSDDFFELGMRGGTARAAYSEHALNLGIEQAFADGPWPTMPVAPKMRMFMMPACCGTWGYGSYGHGKVNPRGRLCDRSGCGMLDRLRKRET
jgi:hypothetical protein